MNQLLTYYPTEENKPDLAHSQPAPAPRTQAIMTNPIIQIASPILAFISHIKKSERPDNMSHIREQIINEINIFEKKLSALGYQRKIVLAVRYCLCTAIDESILKTEWGTQTIWVQHTLLSYFHNETWGGERFYVIVDTLAKRPRQNIAALEFLYTLMSLGFEGKLYSKEAESLREDIRHKTLQLIKSICGKQSRQLATHTIDTSISNQNQQKTKSLRLIALTTLGLVILTTFTVNIKLNKLSSQTINRLKSIATTPAATNFSQLVNRSIYPNHTGKKPS